MDTTSTVRELGLLYDRQRPDGRRRSLRVGGGWRADRDEGGLFLSTPHPHVSGHRSLMPVLEKLIAHAKNRGACWFATHADIARWREENAPAWSAAAASPRAASPLPGKPARNAGAQWTARR